MLGPILAGYDLRLVGGWWDGRILERSVEEEFDALLPHMTLHRDLGAPRVVYADTSRGRHGGIWEPISKRPTLADDEWADYGRKVTALAEKMDAFGVGMAFHHHMGTVVETDAEVDRLMAVTGPAVGLLYDTGHSAFSGGDPVALVRRHAGRIVHVHCKDTRPEVLATARRDDQSFMQAVLDGIFTVPGRRQRRLRDDPSPPPRRRLRGLDRGRGRAGPAQGQSRSPTRRSATATSSPSPKPPASRWKRGKAAAMHERDHRAGRWCGMIRERAGRQAGSAAALSESGKAKRVVIHEDDVGMSHGANTAFVELSKLGTCSSGSVMVPCPWFPEAAAIAAGDPALDVGVHLTLTSEQTPYRWRPLTAPPRSAGLTDEPRLFLAGRAARAQGLAGGGRGGAPRPGRDCARRRHRPHPFRRAYGHRPDAGIRRHLPQARRRNTGVPVLLVKDLSRYNPASYAGPLDPAGYDAEIVKARAAGEPVFDVVCETPWARKHRRRDRLPRDLRRDRAGAHVPVDALQPARRLRGGQSRVGAHPHRGIRVVPDR